MVERRTPLIASVVCFAVLLVGLVPLRVDGANFTLSVKRDSRRVIDLGVFGFYAGGKMHLEFKDFFLHDTDEYSTSSEKIGFTLDKVISAGFARQERNYAIKETKKDQGEDTENTCFVDDAAVAPTDRFSIPMQGSLNQAISVIEKEAGGDTAGEAQPPSPVAISKKQETQLRGLVAGLQTTITIPEGKQGLYALFFYNCKKMNKNKDPAHVSFTVKVSEYNVETSSASSGDVSAVGTERRNYLSAGDQALPMMYTFFFCTFGAALVFWHRIVYDSPPDVLRNVRAIHHVMYALLVFKLLTLLTHIIVLRQRRDTGAMSGGWDYTFYFFQTLKGVFLFGVIVLLGTGWSTLKPFLSDRDRKVLIAVLPLQICANVALAVIEEQSEGIKLWARWRDALRLFDVACCCAVLLPVVWSIRSMRDGASTSRAAARSLARLKQFRTFYISAVAFIYFTRIVVEFFVEYLPFQRTWLGACSYEVAALLFYVFVGHQFQPSKESTIRAAIAGEDEEAAEPVGGHLVDEVANVEKKRAMYAEEDEVEDVNVDEMLRAEERIQPATTTATTTKAHPSSS